MLELKNNGLIIADIHIRKNERYSPDENFRLKVQPLQLLKRMKSLISLHNVGYVCILGDILDTPACIPEETHVLNDFFKELDTWNIPILYILGQHDVNLNRYNADTSNFFEKSNVTVIANQYKNIHYAHDSYVKLMLGDKEHLLYFSNYSDPLVYPSKYVDCWLTHCKIGFVEIETTKFGMMIAGDIHDHINKLNCYTVGTPYQHKGHEQSKGVIGLLKNDDILSFVRLDSDSEDFEFLKIPYEQKKMSYKTETGENVYVDVSINTFQEELNTLLTEKDLIHIHKKIDHTQAPNSVNLFFKLKKLKIENYRSIINYELDFDSFNKILFLYGTNGVGKSTILSAIRDVFYGSTASINESVSFWVKDKKTKSTCKLELELWYEDKIYKIIRGPSLLEFYINDINQTANNMKSLDEFIRDCLPFIDFLDIFIPSPSARLFSKEVGQKLLNRCINLDIFSYYKESAIKLRSLYNDELVSLKNNLTIENDILSKIAVDKNNIEKLIEDISVNNLSEDDIQFKKNAILKYMKTLEDINYKLGTLNALENNYKNFSALNKESILDKIKELQSLKDLFSQYNLYKDCSNKLELIKSNFNKLKALKRPVDIEIIKNDSLDELTNKMNSINESNKEIQEFNADVNVKKINLKNKIESLEKAIQNKKYVCPTCGQTVNKDVSSLEKELVDYNNQLLNLPELKNVINVEEIINKLNIFKIYEQNQKIDEQLNDVIEEGKSIRQQVTSLWNDSFNSLKDKDINSIERELIAYQNMINEIDKYQDYLNLKKDMELEQSNFKNELTTFFSKEDVDLIQELSLVEKELSDIKRIKDYQNLLNQKEIEIKEKLESVEQIEEAIKQKNNEYILWENYIELMDIQNLNSIPYNLLEKLIYNFNTENFKVTTNRTQKNNKKVFDISMSLKISEDFWVPYKNASSGQQLLMEILFFNKIASFLGGLGFFSLDENLNVASEELYNDLNEILITLNIDKIVIITHNQRLSCYDKVINLIRDEKGVTHFR